MAPKERKLKRIGWLMLAGEVMLLLFLAQWLQAQYQAQEKRLHQDIRTLFVRTEEKLRDSLLNQTIAVVLNSRDKAAPHKVQVHIATSFKVDTSLQKDFLSKPFPEETPGNVTLQELGEEDTMRINVKRMMVRTHTGKEQLPEDVQKIFRMAIEQTANSKDLYTRGFSLSVNHATLLNTFRKELQKKQSDFVARWDTASPQDTERLFRYRHRYGNDPAAAVTVSGYRPYLLRSILPQAGFSLVLLLLIGLAFWLAYRVMRQQALFNLQKDSFISNISHELKTPVATTKVAIEALTTYKGIEDPERTKKYLHLASWEMDRLSNMIDRIMNIIQTENGNLVLEKQPVDLTALLQELIHARQPILKEKNIEVVWDNANDPVVLPADKTHLQGVCYNLLDNAVKYGGNLIRIGVKNLDDKVRITIADNGPGIAPEYRKKVFENFFRVPSHNRHDVKGHGLGLSYARDIITAHQGTIDLEGTPGGGATFIITLPLNPAS